MDAKNQQKKPLKIVVLCEGVKLFVDKMRGVARTPSFTKMTVNDHVGFRASIFHNDLLTDFIVCERKSKALSVPGITMSHRNVRTSAQMR